MVIGGKLGNGCIAGGKATMDKGNVRVGQQWKSEWKIEKEKQDVGVACDRIYGQREEWCQQEVRDDVGMREMGKKRERNKINKINRNE